MLLNCIMSSVDVVIQTFKLCSTIVCESCFEVEKVCLVGKLINFFEHRLLGVLFVAARIISFTTR